MPESNDGYNPDFMDPIDGSTVINNIDPQLDLLEKKSSVGRDVNIPSSEDNESVFEKMDSQESVVDPTTQKLPSGNPEPIKLDEKSPTGLTYEFPALEDLYLQNTGAVDFGPMRSAVEKVSGNIASTRFNDKRLEGSVDSYKLLKDFEEIKKNSISMLESLAASSIQLFPDGPDGDKKTQQNSRLDYVLQGLDNYPVDKDNIDPLLHADTGALRENMLRALRMEMMVNKNTAITPAQKMVSPTAGSVASSMAAGALSMAAGAVSKLFTKKSVNEWSDASFICSVNGLLENVRQMKGKTDDSNYSGAVDFYEKNKKSIDRQMKDLPTLLQNCSDKGLTIRGETKDKCLEIQEKLEHIKTVISEQIGITSNDVDKSNSQKSKDAKELMEKMKKMMDGITGPIQSIINAFKKMLSLKPAKQSLSSSKAP